jgi:hypothetical protein
MPQEKSVTAGLAQFVAATQWDALPPDVVHAAKRSLMNFFAVALTGCREPAIEIALQSLAGFSGSTQAAVIGRRERVDPLSAAFLNAASANVLDFCDTHVPTVIHPTAPVAPALFALGDGKRISGRDLILALVLGNEIECRIGLAMSPSHYRRGWHITATCGVFGAAAASGKLLARTSEQLVSALGIAAFLMLAMYGASIGKMAISDIDAATNQAIACCKPHPGIELKYLFWTIKNSKQRLISMRQGGAQPNISQNILRDHLIPLAPTAEQRRIVARIDELFTEIADGDAALARARKELETWRRALLKAAVTGELTREWRQRYASIGSGTGAEVLACVAQARIGYKFTNGRSQKIIAEAFEEESFPEIPETWVWSRLGNLGKIVGGVTVDKKRRSTDGVTVPYLRVANVQRAILISAKSSS